MHHYYKEFIIYFEEENKEKCVEITLKKLSQNEIDVTTLYNQILEPALNNMVCEIESSHMCIWKEHVRSSIIRTIIECCYPYVIKEKNQRFLGKSSGKVVVLCPDGEYHEIGARMVADFFTLSGFDTTFVGSSTPKVEFLSVIQYLMPDYVAISVTNYFNLVSAKATIDMIHANCSKPIKIYVGGHAFKNNPDAMKKIGADELIQDSSEIEKIALVEV